MNQKDFEDRQPASQDADITGTERRRNSNVSPFHISARNPNLTRSSISEEGDSTIIADQIRAWRHSAKEQIIARESQLRTSAVETKEIRGWRKFVKLIRQPYKFDGYHNNRMYGGTISNNYNGSHHALSNSLGAAALHMSRIQGSRDVEQGSMRDLNIMHSNEFRGSPWQRHFQNDILSNASENESIAEGMDTSKHNNVSDETRRLQYDIFGVYFNNKHNNIDEIDKDSSTIKWWLTLINGTMPSLYKYLENDNNKQVGSFWTLFTFVIKYLECILRGIGQIFFCNNPVTGLCILIALFIQSSRVAVHCLIAVIAATISAKFLGFEKSMISSGLFGYNAALLGIALATLHSTDIHGGYTFAVAFGVMVLSILSVLLFVTLGKFLLKLEATPMTLPFDLILSSALLASVSMNNIHFDAVISPSLPVYADDPNAPGYDLSFRSFVEIVLRGVGQVVFTTDLVAISVILLGLTICSRLIALSAITGSALGTAFAIWTGLPAGDVNLGLYSYCSSLTFIATMIFYVPSTGSFLLASFGVLSTVILQAAISSTFQVSGLPVNSFPFSFIMIALVLLQGSTKFVIAVPLESITFPEDHLRRVRLLKDGFNLFLEALHTYGKRYSARMLMNKSIPTRTKKAEKVLRKMYKTFDLGNVETTVGINDPVGQCALEIFRAMDEPNLKGYITTSQFEDYLSTIGLINDCGNKDAVQALTLMDIKNNGIISKQDFIVFCRNSYEMNKIYKIVSTFFQFVDNSGDGFISLDEMNHALKYLNEQALDFEELKLISRISRTPNQFEIDDMTTFVCFSTQKNLVEKYQNSASLINNNASSSES